MGDDVLGFIVWFTIPTHRIVPRPVIEHWCEVFGIEPADVLPRHANDVFRKTMGTFSFEYATPWLGSQMRARVVLRESERTPDLLRYQMIRVVRPVKVYRSSFVEEHIGNVELHRKARGRTNTSNKVKIWPFHAKTTHTERSEALLPVLNERVELYYERYGALDSDFVRGVVRNRLVDLLDGIRLKDGVYFVPAVYGQDVATLGGLVRDLKEGSTFHWVRLTDIEPHRIMVGEHLEGDVSGRLVKLAEALRKPGSVRRREGLQAAYRSALGLCGRYAHLGVTSERVGDLLEEVLELLDEAN